MVRELWNVEWPNINAQRKYPFTQSATLASSSDVALPNDLVVDFVLAVSDSSAPDPTLFHVQQVGVFSAGIVLTFAYNETAFATINVPLTGFVEYTTYRVVGTGDFQAAAGWLTIGSLANTLLIPGAHTFTVTTGKLLPTVIRPRLDAVTSLSVANGQDISTALAGAITLIAGSNIRFRVDTSGSSPEIIIDAIDGSDMEADCDCLAEDKDAEPIRTVNGVGPDAAGNVQIEGGECVTITPSSTGILIEDSCSVPCCGCTELGVITTDLSSVKMQVQTLEMTASKLSDVLQNMSSNVLVSKTTGIPG